MRTFALTGEGGRGIEADFCLAVPAGETPRIQECHILVAHVLCEIAEGRLFGP